MGKALVTSPGKSPNRRLSQRKAPSKGKAPAKALSFASPPLSPPRAATSPSGKGEEAEIVPPPPGYCPPPLIPASTLGRTFNPTHARLAQDPMFLRWSLPIEYEQALQYADAALPADACLFVPPDDDDAAIPTRCDRNSFLQLSLKMAYTVLSHLGALRLPDHSILFPATPEGAEELPFDPIWLTTAGLVGRGWSIR